MEKIARKEIVNLQPYISARSVYPKAKIMLDANESPFNLAHQHKIALNRYPDPESTKLRIELAKYCKVNPENILVGNGSSELIDIAISTFAGKKDNIITIVPGYSLYEVLAQVAGVKVKQVKLRKNFELDFNAIRKNIDSKTKIILFSTPNSVSGKSYTKNNLIKIIENFKGIVLADEAYVEFSKDNIANLTKKYENLIVLRTLSKAWGLAGLRVGYCISNTRNITLMKKTKQPYNLNIISQTIASKVVKNKKQAMRNAVKKIKVERNRIALKLGKLNIFCYPSDGNFILIKLPDKIDSKQFQKLLAKKSIIVRDRSDLPMAKNCIRITIGTKKENNTMLREIKSIITKRDRNEN